MKICNVCRLPQSLENFSRNPHNKDGKSRTCRVCATAYAIRYRRLRGAKPYPPFLNRIWDNIQQCHHEELCPYCCWPWMKSRSKAGYGKIGVTSNKLRSTQSVTRIVFEIWHAMPIPETLFICHYCDNPPCCNPSHLWLGDALLNNRDAMKKKRNAHGDLAPTRLRPELYRGERNGQAKLTKDDVLQIRSLYAQGYSCIQIASLYPQVDKGTIPLITRRVTWTHI